MFRFAKASLAVVAIASIVVGNTFVSHTPTADAATPSIHARVDFSATIDTRQSVMTPTVKLGNGQIVQDNESFLIAQNHQPIVEGLADYPTGLSVQRGDGFITLKLTGKGTKGKVGASGLVVLEDGAKFIKGSNGVRTNKSERPNNGKEKLGRILKDEVTLYDVAPNIASFVLTAGPLNDSYTLFYDKSILSTPTPTATPTPTQVPTATPQPGQGHLDFTFTGPATAQVHQIISYVVTITNISNVTVNNVQAVMNRDQQVPTNSLMFITQGSHTSCHMKDNLVICGGSNLGIGQSVSFTINYKVLPLASATCGSTIKTQVDISADNAPGNWGFHTLKLVCPDPTSTPTPTPTTTPTPTPTPSTTPTPTTTPSPSVTPTPTVTPTSTPTATPSATPTPDNKEEEKGLEISKTDHRDITRPNHTVEYVIHVKNTGNIDIDDLKVTDTVPNKLTVIGIGNDGKHKGSQIIWENVHLGAGETKEFRFKATVKADTANNHVLINKVVARSNDHDLTEEANDTTLVKREAEVAGTAVTLPPQAAITGTPVSVPITAKTGAGAVAATLSTLMGMSGLIFTIRRGL